MPTPQYRTPIKPASGTYAELAGALADLEEREIVWATDQQRHFVVTLDGQGAKQLTAAVAISSADKAKLDGIEAGANAYVLPVATLSVLGGIKADGETVTIDPDGTIHAAGSTNGGGTVTAVSGSAPIQVTNGTTTPLIAVAAASTSAAGVVQLADQAAIEAGTAGRVVDAAGLVAYGQVPQGRTISAGTGLSGGGDLSANRTLSIDAASQAEAEALAANDVVMTPLATGFAIASKVSTSRTITAGTGLSGGGNLSADRTLAVSFASQAEAEAGVLSTVVMSPLRTAQAITARVVNALNSVSTSDALSAAQGKALNDTKVATSRQVIAGTGLSGGGDLSANRTLSIDAASQAEAEALAANDVVMTPLATGFAIASKVSASRAITAGTGLSGGGDLSADRSFALSGQALALHNLASTGLTARTGAAAFASRTITGSNGIAITNGDGVSGNPAIAPTYATQNQAETGSATDVLMNPLRVAQAIAALAPSGSVEVTTFTADGTFTKAANDVAYLVQVWGGGGSGGKSGNADPAGGGGGGGYMEAFFAASQITSTVAVVVGSGGGAVSAIGGAPGNAGGKSSFGSYVAAFGGRGGGVDGNGGSGGGAYNPDAITIAAVAQGGFIGGLTGQPSVYGGGGGNGGASIYGGGGGGRSTGDGSSGGLATIGGDGGGGGTSSSGQGGQEPAGGGGGTQTGATSGAGARGEVRVLRFKS